MLWLERAETLRATTNARNTITNEQQMQHLQQQIQRQIQQQMQQITFHLISIQTKFHFEPQDQTATNIHSFR